MSFCFLFLRYGDKSNHMSVYFITERVGLPEKNNMTVDNLLYKNRSSVINDVKGGFLMN